MMILMSSCCLKEVFRFTRKELKKSFFLVLFLAGLLLSSCSTNHIRNSPSGDLINTVKDFYRLKKLGNFAQAYNYERMSVDEDNKRRETNRSNYISRSADGMKLKKFEILEIGEEGSGPQGMTPVKVKLVTDWPVLPFPVPEGDRVLIMEDLWEKIDGKWYHVVRGMTKFW